MSKIPHNAPLMTHDESDNGGKIINSNYIYTFEEKIQNILLQVLDCIFEPDSKEYRILNYYFSGYLLPDWTYLCC